MSSKIEKRGLYWYWEFSLPEILFNNRKTIFAPEITIKAQCDYTNRRNAAVGMKRAARRLGIRLVP